MKYKLIITEKVNEIERTYTIETDDKEVIESVLLKEELIEKEDQVSIDRFLNKNEIPNRMIVQDGKPFTKYEITC